MPGIKAELSYDSKTCRLITAELSLNVSVNEKVVIPLVARKIIPLGRQSNSAQKKKTNKDRKLNFTCIATA